MESPTKFRTRYVEQPAIQYLGTNLEEIQALFPGISLYVPVDDLRKPAKMNDYRRNVWIDVFIGDYLAQDFRGNFYPIHKEVFEKKYTPVGNHNGEYQEYRPRNGTIKAVHFSGENWPEVARFAGDRVKFDNGTYVMLTKVNEEAVWVPFHPGYFIVCEENGSFKVYEPDSFITKFEEV